MLPRVRRQMLEDAVRDARAAIDRAADVAASGNGGDPNDDAGAAKLLFRERRRRDGFFPTGLFREPAWDILLVLFMARDEGRQLRQVDALRIAEVPGTTGLRILEQLEAEGLVVRSVGDGWKNKRVLSLTDDAIARMGRFLEDDVASNGRGR